METHPQRSFATLWAERVHDSNLLMALTPYLHGKIWLPCIKFPRSGSFSETYDALLKKYRFRAIEEPEIMIRCYRRDNLMWRNVIFKTQIQTPDLAVWHQISGQHDQQYGKYQSSEFLDERSNILSHRIMNIKFFKKPLTVDEEQLFESAGFTKARIDALCCILMDMIWPCELFDIVAFKVLIRRLYSNELRNIKALFRSCAVGNGHFAEPSEVLKLLACLEPRSSGRTRFDLIFRFYADPASAVLTAERAEPLVEEICQATLSEGMAQQTRKFYADLFDCGAVSIEKFRNVLTSARESLRRTKDVLRASCSLFCNPNIDGYDGVVAVDTDRFFWSRDFQMYTGFSTHNIQLPTPGIVVDPVPWWRFYDTSSRNEKAQTCEADFDSGNTAETVCEPNALLDDLKEFASQRQDGCFSWKGIDTSELASKFLNVCATAREIFQSEPRLLLLDSPLYIFGGLRGSYKDLLLFERAFWRLGPHIAPTSFLFLGDYVDPGPANIAVLGHLFACKIIAPYNFYLIRGAHEDRLTNKEGGLLDDCMKLFGESGSDVYEAINAVFDVLPLAAIVDKKLFCVHGGIPECVFNPPYLGAINSVEVDLSSPRKDPVAIELLWNDLNCLTEPCDGFAPNKKTGIGKEFSPAMVHKFLRQFNMSFVIQAHQLHHASDSLIVTQPFSLGKSTESGTDMKTRTACILAADSNIRCIQFTSTNNFPEVVELGEK